MRNATLIPLVCVFWAASAAAQIKTLKPGFNLFSPTQDEQMGKEAAAEVERKMPVVRNAEIESYLNGLVDRLRRSQHAGKLQGVSFPFRAQLVYDKNVNAFALPGGPLFVNTGLILTAESEAQLAGILGHEMSHVVLRHSTNQMSKQNLLQIPAALAGAVGGGGLMGQLEKAGIGLFVNGMSLRFSRVDESQADYNGALVAAEAGYNPLEMAHFFEKLEAQGGAQSRFAQMLSDHPSPGNRVRSVEDEIRQMPQREYGTDTGEFARIQKLVARLQPPPKPVEPAVEVAPAIDLSSLRPSGRLKDYRGTAYAFSYPDNWSISGDPHANLVTAAPKDGVVRSKSGSAMAYGMTVSYYFPDVDALDLNRDTEALLGQFAKLNPGMAVTRRPAPVQVGGQAGLNAEMVGPSPLTGQTEVETLFTVARPEGLFYMMFVCPKAEVNQIQQTVRDVLGSVSFLN